jgi:predicted nucleotidyltransferase
MGPEARRPTRTARLYRRLAAVAGRSLGRLDGVECVYVRRSVASGEASLPRSDIDLSIVVADANSAAVGAVAERFARLRRLLPVLGEAMLHDRADLERWSHLDTYRASIDRRVSIPVHGYQPPIPRPPVERSHALWRLAFWLEWLLPWALRRRDGTTLRKFAIEAVGAHAVAVGAVSEPPLTRAEALQLPAARFLPRDSAAPAGWLQAFFEVVADAHGASRRGVEPLPPGEHHLQYPGYGTDVRLLTLDSPASGLPPSASSPDTVVVTAEALDLLVSCVNPPLWWTLPMELRESVLPPDTAAVRHFALAEASLWRLCAPGLHACALDEPARRVALAADLAAGAHERPAWEPPAARPELVPSSRGDYYARVYPRLLAQAADVHFALESTRVEQIA